MFSQQHLSNLLHLCHTDPATSEIARKRCCVSTAPWCQRVRTVTCRRRTLDGVLISPRAEAVQQLVRVEHEAAYAGRVAGRIRARREQGSRALESAERCV